MSNFCIIIFSIMNLKACKMPFLFACFCSFCLIISKYLGKKEREAQLGNISVLNK